MCPRMMLQTVPPSNPILNRRILLSPTRSDWIQKPTRSLGKQVAAVPTQSVSLTSVVDPAPVGAGPFSPDPDPSLAM